MCGIFLAFKNYSYVKGIFGSDWCGFANFEFLFKTKDAWIMTRNTLLKPTVIILTLMSIGRIFYSDFGLFYQVPQNSGAIYATTQTILVWLIFLVHQYVWRWL